jgi:hypothetical protein
VEGLEGAPLPVITRFKHISKLFVFAEEGGANGNSTATAKKLTSQTRGTLLPTLSEGIQKIT